MNVITIPCDTMTGKINQPVTDHVRLWEQGSGNYHMGYSGFASIRGIEADAGAPIPSTCRRRASDIATTRPRATSETMEHPWKRPIRKRFDRARNNDRMRPAP